MIFIISVMFPDTDQHWDGRGVALRLVGHDERQTETRGTLGIHETLGTERFATQAGIPEIRGTPAVIRAGTLEIQVATLLGTRVIPSGIPGIQGADVGKSRGQGRGIIDSQMTSRHGNTHRLSTTIFKTRPRRISRNVRLILA